MKKITLIVLLLLCTPCSAEQPSFRERYNALAETMAPALKIHDCNSTKNISKNHDTIFECPLVSNSGKLTVSGLNNLFTGSILDLDVRKLDNSSDLMKAGKILLRIARDKDFEQENPLEMIQLVAEAQGNLGKSACVDTPEQHTRFCIVTDNKKVYQFAVVDPVRWETK